MSFRTLEEKFLSDYEWLVNENDRLRRLVMRLEKAMEQQKKNITLDARVRAEGRKAVLDGAVRRWSVPEVGGRDFETWCLCYLIDDRVPKGVSLNEFIEYFSEELEREYEGKIAEEVSERGETK